MNTVYVGIDIAASSAAIHWHMPHTNQQGKLDIKQTPGGYRKLHQHLSRLSSPDHIHIVMEATGNYWLKLAHFLHQQGYHVSVINPLQAKYFAKAQLLRTKTDAVDARLLADYAQMHRPDLWTPPPPICHLLRQCLERRDDLLKMATQEKNRLHAMQQDPYPDPLLRRQLKRHIAQLKAQAKALLARIKALLRQDHAWSTAARHLLSIKGIGPVSAAWLLVATECFTRCQTPKQAAAYAGLVPHHRRSGSSLNGRSYIAGGHAKLRQVLYMAAGSALQHNPILKPFYERKVAEGKIKQVARIAVARKLMHIAWACVVYGRDFDPNYGQLALAA